MTEISKTKTRTRLSPEDRRAQLLMIAIKVFGEMGIDRAGHGDIAKAADVSTGTVFNYFPTSEDLNDAVYTFLEQVVYQTFEDYVENTQKKLPKPSLKRLLQDYPAVAKTGYNFVRVSVNWTGIHRPPYRQRFLEFKEHCLLLLVSLIDNKEHPRMDAEIIAGMLSTIQHMVLDEETDEAINVYVARCVDWLEGIGLD